MLKRIFLHREKDQTKNFSPFLCKRPFDHRKEFLKSSQFHFKGFHFKSTSSSSFNKVWWKNRNHTEIRNPSEAHLAKDRWRSFFALMSFNRYILSWKTSFLNVRLVCKSFISRFSILINYAMWSSNLFSAYRCFPRFS